MKTTLKSRTILLIAMAGASLLWMAPAGAQFSSGSDGSYGPILVNTASGDVTLDIPADGIFHCTTIDVLDNRGLRFNANANNTPVYLLATGKVTITGSIFVDGGQGNSASGGQGGPGAFAGGNPASVDTLPGDGHGPGGGKAGTQTQDADGSGAGGYATQSTTGASQNHGGTYGNALLIPLVGGSGGGGSTGNPGFGGGGGGGAILVASDTEIAFANSTDRIFARGANDGGGSGLGNGSGGAVRLVAPLISGAGQIFVEGGSGIGGRGRIRIDTLNRSALTLGFSPAGVTSIGSLMVVFPSPRPRLDVLSAAGTAIAEGSGPVSVLLPFGSPSAQTIRVQARDFSAVVPIAVVLTPDNGPSSIVEASIDNAAANPATVDVPVDIPANVQTTVHVWTR